MTDETIKNAASEDTDVRNVIAKALMPDKFLWLSTQDCAAADAVIASLAKAGLPADKLNDVISGRAVVVAAEDVTVAKLAEIETKRALLPEDERRRLDAADAPMLRRQLAALAFDAELLREERAEATAAVERVRALLPAERFDSDPTLAIHPSQVRAALPATEETSDGN